MKLDFIVVGAMKSGTTSLFMDLGENPNIFMPCNKEPMYFSSDSYGSTKLRREYEHIFSPAKPWQLKGEGSTTYTMSPLFSGVVERVVEECGLDLKIVYLVRDPIRRIESHLYHDFLAGRHGGDGNSNLLIKSDRRYIDTSRYYYQIVPWLERFGEKNVLIVKFEDFVSNKPVFLKEINTFLGLRCFDYSPGEEIYNESSSKLVPNNFIKKFVTDAGWYKNYAKPLFPIALKKTLSSYILSRPNGKPEQLSKESLKFISQQLSYDIYGFLKITGMDLSGWEYYEACLNEI